MARLEAMYGVNMDTLNLRDLIGAEIGSAHPTSFQLGIPPGQVTSLDGRGYSPTDVIGGSLSARGAGLTYDAQEQLIGGDVTEIVLEFYNHTVGATESRMRLTGIQVDGGTLNAWVVNGATQVALETLFAGDDQFFTAVMLTKRDDSDLWRGFGGNDFMTPQEGSDTVFGGAGNDTIEGGVDSGALVDGENYLRGDEGNDLISGGPRFDDINGNMGADTAVGNGGDDWVVGGKDNDQLAGDIHATMGRSALGVPGNDIVYGNLGDDTCEGDAGNDTVRGGQDNDVLYGGEGADWLSGDRGSDTVTGGLGADIFHAFAEAGLDRVVDFNRAEGDRVQLDPGSTYAVAQVGADTVVTIGDSAQLVLVGVSLSSLTGDWIFVA